MPKSLLHRSIAREQERKNSHQFMSLSRPTSSSSIVTGPTRTVLDPTTSVPDSFRNATNNTHHVNKVPTDTSCTPAVYDKILYPCFHNPLCFAIKQIVPPIAAASSPKYPHKNRVSPHLCCKVGLSVSHGVHLPGCLRCRDEAKYFSCRGFRSWLYLARILRFSFWSQTRLSMVLVPDSTSVRRPIRADRIAAATYGCPSEFHSLYLFFLPA